MFRLIGQDFDGRFRIEALLGEGAYGAVYKATQIDLARPVALKLLRQDLLSDPDAQARFLREARLLCEIEHPNIVRIFTCEISNSIPYFVMEYLDGSTLGSALNSENKPSQDQLLNIFEQICQGMDFAHQRGIIHRDLKPANIFLQKDGSQIRVKILDFGLSKSLGDYSSTTETLTRTGSLLGTAEYMSPEACSGQRSDERSDIYAIGCILFESFTGLTPFKADNPIGLLHKHASEPIPALPLPVKKSAPQGLELVIRKAMQKDPDERFQSFSQFKDALTSLHSGETAKLASLVAVKKRSKNSIIPVIVIISVSVFCLSGLIVLIFRQSQKPVEHATKVDPTSRSKALAPRIKALDFTRKMIHTDLMQLRIPTADAQMKENLDAFKALLPEAKTRKDKIAIYWSLAGCYSDLKDFKNCIKYLKACLPLCQSNTTTKYVEEPGILNQIASTENLFGSSSAAREYSLRSLKQSEEFQRWLANGGELTQLIDDNYGGGPDWRFGSTQAKAELSRLYFAEGNYEQAAKLALIAGKEQMTDTDPVSNDGSISNYILYANCKVKLGDKKEALKELAYFVDHMPKLGEQEMEPNRPLSQKAAAVNTMGLWRDLRDWYSANGETKFANKCNDEVIKYAKRYHLEHLVVKSTDNSN